MRKGAFPEINIAIQPIMDCDKGDDGCHGGDHISAFQYIHDNGITDETCAPYLALSWYEGRKCDDMSHCKECHPSGDCVVPKKYNTYKIGEYGSVSGEQDMMQEIYTRGPIACGVDAIPIENFKGDGIVTAKGQGIDHIVSVVGWGVAEDGTKYWIMRNSWGEYFGDEGWAKILKGNGGAINIEEDCAYAVPIDTWSNQPYPHSEKPQEQEVEEEVEEPVEEMMKDLFPGKMDSFKPGLIPDSENPHALTDLPDEVIKTPRPQDYLENGDIPDNFWWGDNDGVNYLSWTVNQHVPQYCGSCWAQGAESAFADRVNIQHNNGYPRLAMSVQQILNCAAGGTCHGGSLNGVYQFGHKHYLVEFGCRIYEAKDPSGGAQCTPIQNCMNCKWNPDFSSNCWAITDNFRKWYVSEYGKVVGKDQMQKEIFARGPITCGMHVTDNFYNNYKGGIYSENTPYTGANHAVSVVGWGQENGTNYWIVRNSWGTWWGESGYFRINMDKGNLGIGTNACYWAVPTLTPP
jgi:cathepsin X